VSQLYNLELKVEQPVCLLTKTEEASWRWHAWYGHLNFPALWKLSKAEMVCWLPIKGASKLCDRCLISNQKRSPFPSQANYRATKHLMLVHGDLCGPIKLETLRARTMFLLLDEDMSHYMCLKLL
jgi:hypothetical protein